MRGEETGDSGDFAPDEDPIITAKRLAFERIQSACIEEAGRYNQQLKEDVRNASLEDIGKLPKELPIFE